MILTGTAKTALTVLNVILLLIGFLFLILGLVVLYSWISVMDGFQIRNTTLFKNVTQETEIPDLKETGIFVIDGLLYSAIIVMILAGVGLCGIRCNNKIFLVAYAIALFIMIVTEIALMAVCSDRLNEAGSDLKSVMKHHIHVYTEKDEKGASMGWNVIFNKLECCGLDDPKSDFNLEVMKDEAMRREAGVSKSSTTPIYCCRGLDVNDFPVEAADFEEKKECMEDPQDDNFYNQGCIEPLEDVLAKAKRMTLKFGLPTIFIEVALISLAAFVWWFD